MYKMHWGRIKHQRYVYWKSTKLTKAWFIIYRNQYCFGSFDIGLTWFLLYLYITICVTYKLYPWVLILHVSSKSPAQNLNKALTLYIKFNTFWTYAQLKRHSIPLFNLRQTSLEKLKMHIVLNETLEILYFEIVQVLYQHGSSLLETVQNRTMIFSWIIEAVSKLMKNLYTMSTKTIRVAHEIFPMLYSLC